MRAVPSSLTVGIEEEYLLVDKTTRDLVSDPPEALLKTCEAELAGQVTPEFLRSQIEVATRVCGSVQEARADLARLRRTIADVADHHGLAPIAVSTHPLAGWREQRTTAKERYLGLQRELEAVARRMLICGMHVHVGIEDGDLRIDLMNQLTYFLPHLLALSTSSPYWNGEDTGLMSYRLTIMHNLPRTGFPEAMETWGDYERLIDRLSAVGIVEDGTRLWWDIRPSVRFPTLEMRVADVCTRLDDGITVATIYICLLRMLWRLRADNQRWRLYPPMFIAENLWRAQRYGSDGELIDLGKWGAFPFAELVEEIIGLVREDAETLGCVAEIEHAREILARGTSAHGQRHVWNAARRAGADGEEAYRAVVDWLIEESVAGITAG
ncbi:MAG: carboxylate-amine ligase [Rhodospirillaceae bacterium]|nr:carboxylate-amine ligase [Rhodospirillaceae bacterium]